MRRFDRATYVLFLLILMADVARASVPVGGGDVMMLTAASHLQARSERVEFPAVKSADAALPRVAKIRLRLSQWPTTELVSDAAWLAELALPSDDGCLGAMHPDGKCPVPSLGIFEHTESPAP